MDCLSSIGFDDVEESSCVRPGLTTLGGVRHELARALMELLDQVSENDQVIRKRLIEPRLILRGSTGRA